MPGDIRTAQTAGAWGLVNHVVPKAEVLEAEQAMARRLAKGAQVALQFNKRLANIELVDRVNKVLEASLAMEAVTFETADHREAVRAFLEKRPPVFGLPPKIW